MIFSHETLVVKSLLGKLKPYAEQVTNLRLRNLKVVHETDLDHLDCPLLYSPNKIIINVSSIYYPQFFFSPDERKSLEICVAHELGHHVADRINGSFYDCKKKFVILNTIYEGFAEYFALDLMPEGIMSKEKVDYERQARIYEDESKYGLGYRFFKDATEKHGWQIALNIIKNPAIRLKELDRLELNILLGQNGTI